MYLSLFLFSCADTLTELQTKSFVKFYGSYQIDKGEDVQILPDGGYAIIGTILITPHMFGYIEFLLEDLQITNITLNYIFGLLTIFLIIPLFVTSFQYVRKKIGYKLWKKLHEYAYLLYLFVGLHLIAINNDRQLIYIILFGSYGFLKAVMMINESVTKKKKLKLKNGTS